MTVIFFEKYLTAIQLLGRCLSDMIVCGNIIYCEVSSGLEIAALKKDADATLAIMEELLSNVEQIASFRNAPLYEHMEFQEPKEEFLAELKENILNCFRDEESFGFLKEDSRWQELVKNS